MGGYEWSNWSGNSKAAPHLIIAPQTMDTLQEIVVSSEGPIRVAGAGHSFNPLVACNGTIVSLEHIKGIRSHDATSSTATISCGTRIGAAALDLHEAGQAFANMGDIDRQSLGGALATATHGSGATLGAYHASLDALELLDGKGELHHYNSAHDADILHASGVSLGSFGIVTAATIRNEPAYRLRRQRWVLPIEDMLSNFHTMMMQHRSAEFFFVPCSG